MSDDVIVLSVDDLQIYENDIDMAIDDACIRLGIDDLKKEGQRPWKAVMRLVGQNIFKDKSYLKSKVLNVYNNNNIPTNCNSYNYELLNTLCDYYILLSDKYNKLVSIVAFSYFVNIPTTTIDLWKDTELSTLSFKIWKKLLQNREDCLKDKNFDSNNVVGAISIGNSEYGWNMPGVSREQARKGALSAAELPKLGSISSNCTTENRPVLTIESQET